MEDLESKIGQILADPSAMANILSMAKGLGLVPPSDAEPQEAAQADAAKEDAPPDHFEIPSTGDLPFSVLKILTEASRADGKQAALLNALKPFLKPGRREKIDRALKAAKISHMAGYAIKNLDQK